jgi:transcriptional regulator with XRE-family HTH domain
LCRVLLIDLEERVPDYGSPTVRRRRLAAELRRLREHSGLTGDDVASHLGWSASKISRYELARTGLKPAEVGKLLDLYGVRASRKEQLLALAREATEKGWWEAYSDDLPEEYADLIGLESEAKSVWTWQIECVPGLLQTDEYARQVNSGLQRVSAMAPSQMERRVQARLLRQQVLTRDVPLVLSAVIDESALLREAADPPIMRAQLEQLAQASQYPNIEVRILPMRGNHPVIIGSFVILQFGEARETTMPDVVYTEHLRSSLYFEGETDTYLYKESYQRLVDAALSPEDSAKLIANVSRLVWA